MTKCRVVSVTYCTETPKDSLVWMGQLIVYLLMKELDLTPQEAGALAKCSHEVLSKLHLDNTEGSEWNVPTYE
ncbi:hypothetical protein [Brevibacillus thermoruber]|uniref:hypothetical protein n=1 Tax=Brevibacillus thermoruber TaxID=33942 RepID=UPI000555BEE5|nr:hypothetical protein [Brevibacillus thermoruber]